MGIQLPPHRTEGIQLRERQPPEFVVGQPEIELADSPEFDPVEVDGVAAVVGWEGSAGAPSGVGCEPAPSCSRRACPIASDTTCIETPLTSVARGWGGRKIRNCCTRIQSVTPSGNLIVLQLYTATPGQDERLVVIDPATGAVTGSFAFGQR